MNRGNLILAIGTIKVFVMAGEKNDAVKVCDGLLDELIAEIDAAQQDEQADGATAPDHKHDFKNSLYCSVCGVAEF